jgi:hypothetical protein
MKRTTKLDNISRLVARSHTEEPSTPQPAAHWLAERSHSSKHVGEIHVPATFQVDNFAVVAQDLKSETAPNGTDAPSNVLIDQAVYAAPGCDSIHLLVGHSNLLGAGGQRPAHKAENRDEDEYPEPLHGEPLSGGSYIELCGSFVFIGIFTEIE